MLATSPAPLRARPCAAHAWRWCTGLQKSLAMMPPPPLSACTPRAKFRSADPHLQPAAIGRLLTVPFDFTKYCDVPL